ncbi:MAG: phytanoyl-CoA dioxygenase family protein [Pseudomonadota bacterium]
MISRKSGYLVAKPTPTHSEFLASNGYLVLKGALDSVDRLATEINEVFDALPADGRDPRRSERGNEMFRYEMLNRSAACQEAVGHPKILEVIEPLLGEDCHVIANTAWRNPPSSDGEHGGDAWHIDAGPHIPLPEGVQWPVEIPHPVFAIGVHIFLSDCNLEDGPTGVIPGSQRSGKAPPRTQVYDNSLTYEGHGVVPLIAEAGDIAFFVSDVWHRRMPTALGDQGRFFLQVHYGRRDIAQRIRRTSEANHLSDQAIARADTPRRRSLIGLHDPFFYDG